MLKEQNDHAPLHILIVEDSTFLRELFYKVFHQDHLLYAAATAEEGWQLYLDKTPDVIFLDIQLYIRLYRHDHSQRCHGG